jgi:hypothetical protein
VARGRYVEQLQRWLDVYPRRQLLVLRSEDLYASPAEVYHRILGFLDLPAWEPPEFRNYSFMGPFGGTYPDPPNTVRRFLADAFAEPNRRLVDLLGEEFQWDTPPTAQQRPVTRERRQSDAVPGGCAQPRHVGLMAAGLVTLRAIGRAG